MVQIGVIFLTKFSKQIFQTLFSIIGVIITILFSKADLYQYVEMQLNVYTISSSMQKVIYASFETDTFFRIIDFISIVITFLYHFPNIICKYFFKTFCWGMCKAVFISAYLHTNIRDEIGFQTLQKTLMQLLKRLHLIDRNCSLKVSGCQINRSHFKNT